ncbi:MAG: AarF/ABC1/UbiB kinase family protein, partial [Pseudomonadota bacterium]
DTGDLLPPELSEIFARLRADARPMPGRQLKMVLSEAWGRGWLTQFSRFDVRPIAAASIGQVHRARTKDGRDLAIKIQYPGVAQSIDSDVDNVAKLIALSGVLPDGLALEPLLEEAKRQLHEEADYIGEGARLELFADAVADEPDIITPRLQADLTTKTVLAMTFEAGKPVEKFDAVDQATRDRIAGLVLDLLFKELFTLRLMQTDPNFANFFYDPARETLVLLDFGAAKAIPAKVAEQYRTFLRAGVAGDHEALARAADDMGFLGPGLPSDVRALLIEMMTMVIEPLRLGEPFDFAASDLPMKMRDKGLALQGRRDLAHVPPIELLYIQRKIGGVFLLASRLRARLDIGAVARRYL